MGQWRIVMRSGKFNRIVLFDVDDTLISSTSLGMSVRPLFFPETTRKVIETLLDQGDHVIISSSATSTKAILDSLTATGLNCEPIEIYGAEETNQWPEGTYGYGKKLTKALSIMTELGAESVIIVDDAVGINSAHDQVVHILVPTPPQNALFEDQPPESDNYLKVALLSTAVLKAQVKPLVNDVICGMHKGVVNHNRLNVAYDSITKKTLEFDISMQVLSGFIAVIGLASVAVAFIALNAATFGAAGVIVAAVGIVATILGGIGFFKYVPADNNRQVDLARINRRNSTEENSTIPMPDKVCTGSTEDVPSTHNSRADLASMRHEACMLPYWE